MKNFKAITLIGCISLGLVLPAQADEFPVWDERPMDFYWPEEEGLVSVEGIIYLDGPIGAEAAENAAEQDPSWGLLTAADIRDESGEYKQTRPKARDEATASDCAPVTSPRPQARPLTQEKIIDGLIASLFDS